MNSTATQVQVVRTDGRNGAQIMEPNPTAAAVGETIQTDSD